MKMGKETQAGHTPRPSENTNNQSRIWKERASRGGAHTETPQERKKSGIPNTFKRSLPEFGAVLGIKDENYKEIFQNLQECVF